MKRLKSRIILIRNQKFYIIIIYIIICIYNFIHKLWRVELTGQQQALDVGLVDDFGAFLLEKETN